MLDSVLMALFLPCLGMSAVFIVYMCLLWYATTHQPDQPLKPVSDKGLSPSQLDNLPKITGKDLVLGTECAVCLDEIGPEQPARVVPGCNHGFHLECADTWLSKHPLCPVCRAKLDPLLFSSSQNPCWTFHAKGGFVSLIRFKSLWHCTVLFLLCVVSCGAEKCLFWHWVLSEVKPRSGDTGGWRRSFAIFNFCSFGLINCYR